MSRLISFLMGAFTSARMASAQMSDQTQNRLEELAIAALQSSESLSELADASELLSLLKRSSDSVASKACKRISKLASEAENTPAVLFSKVQLYEHLKCGTLSGVASEVDNVLTAPYLKKIDDTQLYFAFQLHEKGSALGSNNESKDRVRSAIIKRAKIDWIPNFSPDKWTLKRYIMEEERTGDGMTERISKQELDSQLLNVTEMMASVAEENEVKTLVTEKLGKGFKLLIEKAMPSSGQFFVSKSNASASELTFSALKAIERFNRQTGSKIDNLDPSSLRDYFLVKANASQSV